MRKLTIVIGILLVAGILILGSQEAEKSVDLQQQQNSTPSIGNPSVDSSFSEPVVEQIQPLEPAEPIVEKTGVREVDEQQLLAFQDELEALIQEYDQHLQDPEKRAEIERQVKIVSDKYKQEVLAKVKSLQ